MENCKILIANTCESHCDVEVCMMKKICLAMDTDKIKVFGARVKVDGTGKLAELERAEKVGISTVSSSTSLTHLRKK